MVVPGQQLVRVEPYRIQSAHRLAEAPFMHNEASARVFVLYGWREEFFLRESKHSPRRKERSEGDIEGARERVDWPTRTAHQREVKLVATGPKTSERTHAKPLRDTEALRHGYNARLC